MSAAGGFLARWSRRKRAQADAAGRREPPHPADGGAAAGRAADAVGGEAAGEPAEDTPPAQAAALPPVEALTLGSDFSAFLKDEVGEALRRQALKKLFADPRFNRMDGLDVYIDDYSLPAPIPAATLVRLRHARTLRQDREAPGGRPLANTPLAAAGDTGAAGKASGEARVTAPPADPAAVVDGEGAVGKVGTTDASSSPATPEGGETGETAGGASDGQPA